MPIIPRKKVNISQASYNPGGPITSGLSTIGTGLKQIQSVMDVKARQDGAIIAAEKYAEMNTIMNDTYLEAKEKSEAIEDPSTGTIRSMLGNETTSNYLSKTYEETKKNILNTVTNPYAKQALQRQLPSLQSALTIRAMAFEAESVKAEKNLRFSNLVEDLGRSAVDNLDMLPQYLEAANTYANEMGADNKTVEIARNNMAVTAATGLLQRDPKTLLLELNKDTSDVLFDELTGDQIAQFRARAESKVEAEARAKNKVNQHNVRSYLMYLESGGGRNLGIESQLSSGMGEVQLQEFSEQGAASYKQGQFIASMDNRTFAENEQLIESMKPTEFSSNFEEEMGAYRSAVAAYSGWRKNVESDPAGYAQKKLSSVSDEVTPTEYRQLLLAEQEAIGIPHHQRKILSQSESDVFANTILEAQSDPARLIGTVNNIAQQFEDPVISNKVLKEVADNNSKVYTDGYRTLIKSHANGLPISDKLAVALSNYRDNKNSPKNQGFSREFRETMFQNFNPYKMALTQGNDNALDLIRDQEFAVEALAHQYYANGRPINEAVDLAFNQIVSQNIHPVDSGEYLLPLQVNDGMGTPIETSYDDVDDLLVKEKRKISVSSDEEMFKALSNAHKQKFKFFQEQYGLDETQFEALQKEHGLDQEQFNIENEDYEIDYNITLGMSQVTPELITLVNKQIQDKSVWLNAPNASEGVILHLVDDTGLHVPVYGKSGKPISRSFYDIQQLANRRKQWEDKMMSIHKETIGISP